MKLTPTQKKALALLPLPLEQYRAQVSEKVRNALEGMGLVQTGRRRTVYADTEPTCGPLLAWPRTRKIHPAFAQMLAESQRVGLPKTHRMDLRFDRDILFFAVPDAFIWILRECGTCLYQPLLDDPDGWSRNIDSHAEFRKSRFYVVTRGSLSTVTPREAKEWLRDQGNRLRGQRGVRLGLDDYDLRLFVEKRHYVDDARPTVFFSADRREVRDGLFYDAVRARVPLAMPYGHATYVDVVRHPVNYNLVIAL